jgi:hypothetical protein
LKDRLLIAAMLRNEQARRGQHGIGKLSRIAAALGHLDEAVGPRFDQLSLVGLGHREFLFSNNLIIRSTRRICSSSAFPH